MKISELSDNDMKLLCEITKSPEGYISVAAICCSDTGCTLDIASEYSRGAFKRAIALLRMAQNEHQESHAIYEKAILHIRREWLHREAATR